MKFVLAFFVFFLAAQIAAATTFIVTSNADAGPGTLREALNSAAANGTATQDIIQFNLPGSLQSDRTIRLKSQLPDVTSNVVIDGTSQPGIAFGVSDARVIIEPDVSPANFNGLEIWGDYTANNTVATGIEIYGLYIRNFAPVTSLTSNTGAGAGIYFTGGASGIKIGAPGKGNIISGNWTAIYSSYAYYQFVSDITIQSNIIGLEENGTTLNSNYEGINIQADKSITIGGDDVKDGNVIAGSLYNINISNSYYYVTNTLTVIIKNNKIGTDITGTVDFKNDPLFADSPFIFPYGIYISSSNTNTSIINNVISGQRGYGIALAYNYNYATTNTFSTVIQGNKIGTDVTGTKDLGNNEGILVSQGQNVVIGGADPADVNYIGYNATGIEVKTGANVQITRNSIFCNTDVGIVVPSNFPFIQILKYSGSGVSGLATANTAVELFYIDNCTHTNGNCQGQTYITTVQADANGRWSYSGSLTNEVVATATDGNKNTSAFSTLSLLPNEAVVKHYTCAYKGSITISEPRQGILFHWDKIEDNGTLTPEGDVQSISNLDPGTYQLTIQYPGGCLKTTQTFEIKDNRIKIQQLILPTPQCRQKQFQVDVLFSGGTGNVQFQWLDANGNVVGTGHPATVPGGNLQLRITDDAGCSVTSDPFTITPKVGPDFNYSAMNIHPAMCGKSDGSVTGITAFDITGTATYQWYAVGYANNGTEADTAVPGATSPDLTGVPGGTYYLVITDQSECSPWSSQMEYISTTNSVFIYSGTIMRPTCGLNNGSIIGTSVVNADQYVWTGPNGVIANNNKLDLTNLGDGTYTLTATNTTTHCSNSVTFIVSRIDPDVFNPTPQYTPATCGQDNGGVALTFTVTVNTPAPNSAQWFDAANNPVAAINGYDVHGNFTSVISNVKEGTYTVYLTDHNNCSIQPPLQYEVTRIPILAFDASSNPTAASDVCDLQTGSITGVKITGGQGPYSYTWTDANGKVAGNALDLTNVGKGVYTLVVNDAINCQPPLTITQVVDNVEETQTPPVLPNTRICNPQKVAFVVSSPQTGTYKLYQNADDATPLVTSTTGVLEYQVNATADYYVSYSHGSCESARTKVHVEVILVDIKMGNSFTPNGDGINDKWTIQGLEKFPGSVVQVFTRYGQLIFESKQPTVFFDGNWNGQPLSVGTYYYIINLNTPCKILSGSLALIR